MIKWILLGILTLAPTSGYSNEEIDICVCENDDNIAVIQNVGEEQYVQLQKYENDLLCTLLITNRVDSLFKKDILVCTKDANT